MLHWILGFKEKKNRTVEAKFIRQKENGLERIGVSTYNYYPKVVFDIGTAKRINQIEDRFRYKQRFEVRTENR